MDSVAPTAGRPPGLRASWPSVSLAEVVSNDRSIVYGIIQAGPNVDDGVPYIKSADVGGRIELSRLARTSHKIAARYSRSIVRPGDIVFSLRGNIGELSIVPPELPEANLTQGTARIAVGMGFDTEYVAHALASPAVIAAIAKVAKGSTFQEISLGQLRLLQIPAPPLGEQKRIAAILRTWDEAIDDAEQLVAAKEARLGGLRHTLMIGGRAGDYRWKRVELGDLTKELGARNTDRRFGRDEVMGVTKAHGLVPMREQTMAADLLRYQVLPPRSFAYNPMRINVGSITMSRLARDVIVSPDYVLFSCIESRLLPEYLDQLRQTHFWSHYINAAGAGSVRIRIYYDALAEIAMPVPPIEDQHRVLAVLNDAVADLAATERHCDALRRQKRGLMQKLLTGEWRTTTSAVERGNT